MAVVFDPDHPEKRLYAIQASLGFRNELGGDGANHRPPIRSGEADPGRQSAPVFVFGRIAALVTPVPVTRGVTPTRSRRPRMPRKSANL